MRRSVRLEEAGVNCKVARLVKAEALDSESNRASRFAHACLMTESVVRDHVGLSHESNLLGGAAIEVAGRARAK